MTKTLHAFPADAVSYRHSVKGSLLIQYVVDVFNTYAHQDHIHELFRKVSLANGHLGVKLAVGND